MIAHKAYVATRLHEFLEVMAHFSRFHDLRPKLLKCRLEFTKELQYPSVSDRWLNPGLLRQRPLCCQIKSARFGHLPDMRTEHYNY